MGSSGDTPRVLFLNHVGIVGGGELCMLDVARHYRGTSSVVLFADGPLRGILEDEGIDVRVLPARWALLGVRGRTTWPSPRSLVELLRLTRAIARMARDHDVIYANSPKAAVAGCAAARIARRPLVWALNDILDPAHFSRANIRFSVFLANRLATRVIATSRATRDAFVAHGGDPGKVDVVYPGIDQRAFRSRAPSAPALGALGLDDVPTAGVFGRITPWKGQHVLIEALAELPGVHAVVVGVPPPEDEEYASRLRACARERGVEERVHFLLHRDDVAAVMGALDVVVHASTAPEPFGRVLVEAMVAERPLVATRAGGAPEIVDEGVTGLLVRPGDAHELAVAVKELLDDPERARAMAAAGRARAVDLFSLERSLSATALVVQRAAGLDRM